MPVQTFAPSVLTFALYAMTFAPRVLTFAPCACGVVLLSTSASTPLAGMVVSPVATCAGGLFSSTHWHRYSWWYVVVDVEVVDVVMAW